MQGGIVGKSQAWRQKKRAQLLPLEDPQQPGIDIGSGSFNITEVTAPPHTSIMMSLPDRCSAGALRCITYKICSAGHQIKRYLGEAHARLQSACGQPHARHAAAQQAAAWAAVQVDGQDASVQQPTSAAFPLLSGLLNVSLALDRNPQAAQVCCALSLFCRHSASICGNGYCECAVLQPQCCFVQARSELAVAFGNVSAKRRNKLAVSINRLRAAAVHSPRAARRAAQLLAPAPAGRPKKKKKKKKKKTDSKVLDAASPLADLEGAGRQLAYRWHTCCAGCGPCCWGCGSAGQGGRQAETAWEHGQKGACRRACCPARCSAPGPGRWQREEGGLEKRLLLYAGRSCTCSQQGG